MNQEITYSEKLFSFLYEDNSPYDLTPQKKVWQIIKQNNFVVDHKKKLLERYAKEILALPDNDRKNVLKNFVDGMIHHKGDILKILPVESKENLDIVLSLFSKDKIYFTPERNEIINSTFENYPNIELHDHTSFINPTPRHRLKNLPTLINLEKEKKYHFRNIVSPFFRNIKNVEIIDPYLPNKIASINFFRIVKCFKGVTTTLKFLGKSDYLSFSNENTKTRENRYVGFINKLEKLNKLGYRISIHNHLHKGHVERYIFTDSVQIYLPGGLDFLDKSGIMKKQQGKKELRVEELVN